MVGAFATGCGGGDDSGLASLAPPDARLYVEATIPEGDQADAIDALAGRFGVSDTHAWSPPGSTGCWPRTAST